MRKAEIDYGGGGRATIWGDFPEDQAHRVFYHHANDMFGIRKSIMDDRVLYVEEVDALPEPWGLMKGAAFVLEHNCGGWPLKDTAVWNKDGDKIKSEWD